MKINWAGNLLLIKKLKLKLDEAELVSGLKNHERKYFEYFYENYSGALYGMILSIVNNKDIAEEIMQDTFVKIWDKIKDYDATKGRLFTWAASVARNLSLDKLRSREISQAKQTGRLGDYVNSDRKNIQLYLDIDSIGIRDLLKKLPKEQEFVVEHLYFKGYTQVEISEEFKIPMGTIKTRLSLALKKLKLHFPSAK